MVSSQQGERVTRRRVLQTGLVLGGTSLLAACSQPAAPAATTAAQATATKAPAQVPQTQATAAATAAATKAATQAPAAATKAAGEPKRGGTLTVGRTATTQSLSPHHSNIGHYAWQLALYDTLAYYDSSLTLQPSLAEKWDIAADGKQVRLKLREGVKFHSGREFTSQDVADSLTEAIADTNTTMRELLAAVKKVDTPEKYVAVLNFDNVYSGVYDLLDAFFIIDKETFADRAKTAIGTGPFKLENYKPRDVMEMVPFKDYWRKGHPYLDKYIVRDIPDASALSIGLEAGALDVIWSPSFTDAVRLKGAGDKFIYDNGARGSIMMDIGLNTTFEPFKKKEVRQAIAWAVDRARFCRTAVQGLSEPTNSIWPAHSWAYFKDLEGKIGYDLERSKALLKLAGMESGFETEILVCSKISPAHLELAVMLQSDFAKIGIKGKVVDVDQAAYNTRHTTKRDIELMIHNYGRAGRDPGTTLTGAKAWYTEEEKGWTRFASPRYTTLKKEALATLDREKRKVTFRQIQELMLDEVPTIVVAELPRPFIYGKHVKGLAYNLDNAVFAGDLWLDK
ncbi:MAG: ABC transporter substrate-binding protein [Chloroflexota bacterium]